MNLPGDLLSSLYHFNTLQASDVVYPKTTIPSSHTNSNQLIPRTHIDNKLDTLRERRTQLEDNRY
jgi:hypothetical protein